MFPEGRGVVGGWKLLARKLRNLGPVWLLFLKTVLENSF